MHTSTPSFKSDQDGRKDQAGESRHPIGLIGADVAVEPEKSLKASGAIDFVARNEFDFTIKEVADGRPWREIAGLS